MDERRRASNECVRSLVSFTFDPNETPTSSWLQFFAQISCHESRSSLWLIKKERSNFISRFHTETVEICYYRIKRRNTISLSPFYEKKGKRKKIRRLWYKLHGAASYIIRTSQRNEITRLNRPTHFPSFKNRHFAYPVQPNFETSRFVFYRSNKKPR